MLKNFQQISSSKYSNNLNFVKKKKKKTMKKEFEKEFESYWTCSTVIENIRLFDLWAEPFDIKIISFSDSIVQSA